MRGQPGKWWVIQADLHGEPVFWTGTNMSDGRPVISYDYRQAAQFSSQESAEFAKWIIGGPPHGVAVQQEMA